MAEEEDGGRKGRERAIVPGESEALLPPPEV